MERWWSVSMKTKYGARQSQSKIRAVLPRLREQLFKIRIFCALVLMLLLTVSLIPVGAVATTNEIYGAPIIQGASTLTFPAEADARVQEANRNTNYGNATTLLVNGLNNPDVESFIRFTVSGVTGPLQTARLRVYVTTNSSTNGPAVYGANNTWTETGITWNNRPARTTNALDNKASTSTNTWIDYNVSALITGNGTYTVVLVADSSDGITFSSREGSRPSELVVTLTSTDNTATFTQSPTATQTATQTPTSTSTATASQTATQTASHTIVPTDTQSPTASPTSTLTPTPTETTGTGNTLTFTTLADARVSQLNPTTNYGTATTLQADGDAGQQQISYIRFTTSG